MKLVLSALLVLLVLSQVAEAKKKVVVTQDNAATAQVTRPPLDDTSTGGIRSAAGATATATEGQQYPPALYFNFQ
ncbi:MULTISPECIES: hypothetical protein [Mesorhizobium]|uniref:hypothetical protein n=1 Tax=Mesorhizobium TaxID=68287 RepID=UPI0003CF391A|nr:MULTISPECIES: hypothetical protein [Mesorhizobium]ESY66665.1 peptidoglycan-associated lipoprotein [Mesorhizobium sp. LNHC232B00]WJI37971.1 hypothetical protein NL534_29560 [Mesorhizobium opportunistum]